MKKFFTLLCVSACMLTAMAQYQIQNPGFEEWENEETSSIEPAHWNSFMSGTGNLKGMAAGQQVDKSNEAHRGDFSVRIYARSVFGVVAQGNLTTGCINMGSTNATDANGNYNYTNEDDEAYHQKFTGLPDAMRVWVKASCAYPAGASCNLHTAGYFQDPAGNTITATRIAKANTSDIASSDDWQEVIIPFEYDVTDGTRPAYALVTLTTSGTPGQGNKNDAMLVDDVEFLYYSELTGITFNRKNIEVTGTTIKIDGTYDEALLELRSNGRGATISTNYIETSKTLTVSIKGDNISEDPANKHTYILVFSGKENEEPEPEPEPQPEPQPTIVEYDGSLVPYGDFEIWESCGTTLQPGDGDRLRPGEEPEGWNGSSLNLKISSITKPMDILVEKCQNAARNGAAIKLTNKNVSFWGNNVTFPGYVTYGSPWAWSGSLNFLNSDGGVFGGITYTKRPDAIRGQFKRLASTPENAHIIAYLWKGTIRGKIGAYDDPSTEKDDLDRAIMGHATVTSSDGQLIASCDYTFENTENGDWQTITAPLTYVEGQEDAIPEKMNIIISSGDYWSRNIKAGNTLEADSIEFLFYSNLASATYDGQELIFDEKNSAVVNDSYNAQLLQLTTNGRSATIETQYNDVIRLLTITVKGGNFDENEQNFHTYTIQFPFFSDLTQVTYKGMDITFDEENKATIDDNYDEGLLQLTPHDAAAVIEKSYNNATRVLTITVKGGNYDADDTNVHTYRIEFLPQEKIIRERSYTDLIQVTVNDVSNELQNATITLQEWNTGSTSLILKNFKMGSINSPMYVGSIVVNDILLQSDGAFQKSCNTTIQAGDDPANAQWLGPVLGEVPLEINGMELTGRDTPDSLHVQIQIDLRDRMGQFIDVLFGQSLIDSQQQGGGDTPTPGLGKITLPDHQDYVDDLIVTVNGEQTLPQTTTISIDFHKNNNTLDLILKDFKLQDTGVGTINVKGIGYTLKNGIAYATFNKNVTVAIEGGSDPNEFWMGPMLGEIPITLAGKAGVEKLYCTIDINMTGIGIIHVDFGTDADWPKIESGGDNPGEPEENPILQDRIYTDMLTVTVNGESSQPEEAQVHMTINEDGTVALTIKNFYLITEDGSSAPIGNLEVVEITPVEMPGKDYYLFETNQTIRIINGDNENELWMGPYLGEIPLSMTGKIAQGKLYCNINIFMASMGENINVTFGEYFTDGIEEVQGSKFKVQDSDIYNLSGQRMSRLQKGVNILNGKKILVR